MGGSTSKAAGSRAVPGGSSIDDKLSHLRSHFTDTMVTHGLIQEITAIINKNTNNEKERFCQLLLQASLEGQRQASVVESTAAAEAPMPSSSLPSFQPFAELFQKVRLMTDAASRSSVAHWLRHVTEANEAEWMPILVRNGVVGFIVDFYQFQANTHVPPDTLANVAQLLAKWSESEVFASAMNSVDAFRGVLVRLRFAQSNGKERSFLLSAMRRCHRQGVSRNESMEILLKIAVERDETVEQTHVDCLEMLADALTQRPELINSYTMKQVNSFQRFFASGNALIASVMRLFVTMIETGDSVATVSPPTPAVANGDAPSPVLSQRPLRPELAKSLCGAFDISLMDNPHAVAPYLIATCAVALTEGGKDECAKFVNQRWLTLLVRKVGRAVAESSDVALRFARLTRIVVRSDPSNLSSKVAASGALHLLLDCILVAKDETAMAVIVAAAAEMSLGDPTVGASLCADHKLHRLMQTISSPSERVAVVASLSTSKSIVGSIAVVPTPEVDPLLVVWGTVRLLESLLTPQVMSTADEMLIQTVYSLLCQILGSCTIPSRRFCVNSLASPHKETAAITGSLEHLSVSEKIMHSCLQMLTDRCALGPSYAENILGQVPLGTIRTLGTADHLPEVSLMARSLTAVMANASPSAMAELKHFGCLVKPPTTGGFSNAASKVMRVTLRKFQRHWKQILHVRRVSEHRVRMANVIKDTFMTRLDTAYTEGLTFQQIVDSCHGNLERIQRDFEEREQLMEEHARQTELVCRSEGSAKIIILLLQVEDAEQRFRFKLRLMEQHVRLTILPKREICGEECLNRCAIVNESDTYLNGQFQFHRHKLQELQLQMVKRKAIVDAEVYSRTAVTTLQSTEFRKLLFVHSVYVIVDAENIARRALTQVLLIQHVEYLKESFVILLRQSVEDEIRLRGLIEQSRIREHKWLVVFHEHTELLQSESYARLEWAALENQSRSALCVRFLAAAMRQVEFDERRERSQLMRDVVLEWRVRCLPFERMKLLSEEDIKRRTVAAEHRVGHQMLSEASRYSKPFVCELEELRQRQEIDAEYLRFSTERKWELAFFRLVQQELASRNAVSLQYYHIARNILAPLMILRLMDYQHRMLVADLDLRSSIFVEERDEFFAVLLGEVRDLQKLFRTQIGKCQAVDHERLAQHFVTVTHVVRLQEQAQKTLIEFEEQQRALELHSGLFSNSKKKKKIAKDHHRQEGGRPRQSATDDDISHGADDTLNTMGERPSTSDKSLFVTRLRALNNTL